MPGETKEKVARYKVQKCKGKLHMRGEASNAHIEWHEEDEMNEYERQQ